MHREGILSSLLRFYVLVFAWMLKTIRLSKDDNNCNLLVSCLLNQMARFHPNKSKHKKSNQRSWIS